MLVTEVQIQLNRADEAGRTRVLAYANVILDDSIVIRGIKVVRLDRGPVVAMPARKVVYRCPECRGGAGLVDRFCPRCGAKFPGGRTTSGGYFADVVHPIRASTRAYLHGEVIRAFEAARDDQLAAKEAS